MTAIRFEGGGLDGRTAEIPGTAPPRGMDVEHDGQVERYGFERADGTGAVFTFVAKRRELSRRGFVMPITPGMRGVPLGFYPNVSAAGGRRRSGSSPGR